MTDNDRSILRGNTTGFKRALDAFLKLLCVAVWPENAKRLWRDPALRHPEDDEDTVIQVLEEARNVWKPLFEVQAPVPEEELDEPEDTDPA